MEIKLGSLFDGSGGFPLAGILNGITPVWASEIEPYPIKVTKARLPGMKHLGSVLDINGAEIEPVDVITFGSHCQDLSIAGKQKGIHEGERSNLFFEAVRIIKEMRARDRAGSGSNDHIRPRFAVWENVPGAFTSNKGADFRAVLQALAEIKAPEVSIPEPPGKWRPAGCIVGTGWSIAWRVYDAQFWGVPQRRKRIYLVADFASERAGELLFEREGLRGHSAAGENARQGAAAASSGGAGESGVIAFHCQQDPINGRISPCIGAQEQATVGVVICFKERAGKPGGGKGILINKDNHAFTLSTLVDQSVAHPVYSLQGNTIGRSTHQNGAGVCEGISHTLTATDRHGVATPYIVRRLTPLECCRLQGFPDWWEDGVEGRDSARYKMWGNGIALPCAADVLRRVAKAMREA